MFKDIFFLIIVLLISDLTADHSGFYLSESGIAFLIGLVSYSITLSLIVWAAFKAKKFSKKGQRILFTCCQILLVGWLSTFFYLLGAYRFFLYIPLLGGSHVWNAFFAVATYFFGTSLFYWFSYPQAIRGMEVTRQLRIVIPFVIPFFIFSAFVDLLAIPTTPFPGAKNDSVSFFSELLLLFLTLAILALSMVFLPFFIQKIWKAAPIRNQALLEELESLCQRVGFSHGGMLTWTVMNPYHTAAIVGVIPKFRYVLFTQSLIENLPSNEVLAVLGHEIGHTKYHHMLKYPAILLGMVTLASLSSMLLQDSIVDFIGLQRLLNNGAFYSMLEPFMHLCIYILVISLYFRFIFGYFSRLFERQADLYPHEIGIPLSHMIGALDNIAHFSGRIHRQPSWHHYSIQERIDFLEHAAENPKTIQNHKKVVNRSFYTYLLILGLMLVLLFSPTLSSYPPFAIITKGLNRLNTWVSQKLTSPWRRALVEKYVISYHLEPQDKAREALNRGFEYYGSPFIPGLLEYYGAMELYQENHTEAAASLMINAWQRFDFSRKNTEDALPYFNELSQNIIEDLPKDAQGKKLKSLLREAQKKEKL